MKVVVVTCHKDPDYVRARTLRAGVADYPGAQLTVIKNHQRNLLRYLEVPVQLIINKLRDKPDLYVLTFRGYETLPFLLLLAGNTPVIYDEFVNPLEWLKEPRAEWWAKFVPWQLLRWFYRHLLNKCRIILTDTKVHADYSADLSGVGLAKFFAVPVGTDENLFKPLNKPLVRKNFQVFYYGNMLPLHGLEYVLQAADNLKNISRIRFLIVGGKPKMAAKVKESRDKGARIEYMPWLAFDEIPNAITSSNLCLGGPFGKTTQANMVITGKTYQFLASGAPTVVGKTRATKTFKDKQNSLVVPLGDADSLTAAILWAYKNRNDLSEIGEAGRKLYEAKYSQKIISHQLSDVIAEIA